MVKGHKHMVTLLVGRGADVNARTKAGWTALHFAAREGYADVVELLLASGADVSVKASSGHWSERG
jgi:ankyrin repeat protein